MRRAWMCAAVLAGCGASGDVCRDFPGQSCMAVSVTGAGAAQTYTGLDFALYGVAGDRIGGGPVAGGPVTPPVLVALHGFEAKGVRAPMIRRVDLLFSVGAQVVATKQVGPLTWAEGQHLAASVVVP